MSAGGAPNDLPVDPHPWPGRWERKKSQTRRSLRNAAVRLVSERGLDAVTIEDITDAADVSLRTFFNYFSSKEQALTAADPSRLLRMRAALAARPPRETPLQALRAVLISETEDLDERRNEWLQQLVVIRSDPRLLAALAASWSDLEQELAAGLVDRLGSDQALRADVLAGASVAAMRVAIRRWNDHSGDPLAKVLNDAFDALTHAVPGSRRTGRPPKQPPDDPR